MINLFGWAESGPECTQSLFSLLAGQNISVVITQSNRAVVVHRGTWFELTDNGGEIAVDKINHNWHRDIPYTSCHGNINTFTVTLRLLDAFNNRTIDYEVEGDYGMDIVVRQDIFSPP